MQAFFFGPPERRLFGAFHPASGLNPGQAALRSVLICGPYGQEYVRSHRMLRVLADRLSRAGCDVLRFDPFGSGDSDGQDEALDLPGWVADIGSAAEELRRRSAASASVWVGARLGGTAACGAACALAVAPRRLVLCEPVLDGPKYLSSLALATVQALEASCSIRDAGWRRGLRDNAARWEREAVGFAMGAALHRQLGELQPPLVRLPAGVQVVLLGSDDSSPLAEQAQRWCAKGVAARHEPLHFPFDWTAEEALNTALVPHEMLQRLLDLSIDDGLTAS